MFKIFSQQNLSKNFLSAIRIYVVKKWCFCVMSLEKMADFIFSVQNVEFIGLRVTALQKMARLRPILQHVGLKFDKKF